MKKISADKIDNRLARMLNATIDAAKAIDLKNEQTRTLVLSHLSKTHGLLERFLGALPDDQTELRNYISVWLNDLAQTLQAVMLLYEKDFTIQALSLTRAMVEAYFTLVWLYEENDPELRLLLLQYHLLKKSNDYQNKLDEEMAKRGETIISHPAKDSVRNSVDKFRDRLLKTYPQQFPDEASVNEALRNIHSYPKIAGANKTDEYKENERLYNMLSVATHPKDLTKRVFLNEKNLEVFYNDSMMLVDACFTVLHLMAFVGKKRSMDMSPFQKEMLELHQKGEWLIFFRYP